MEKKRDRLIAEIFEDMQILKRRIVGRRQFGPSGPSVSPAQAMVLHIVHCRDGLSIKEIAETMHVSGSAVTQFVDSLVKADLLTRDSDSDDRRTVRISLTERGKKQLAAIKKFQLERTADLLRPLDESELRTFRDLQRRIIGQRQPGAEK